MGELDRGPQMLVGTTVHNTHLQHIVRAIHESGSLYAFETGGVDTFHAPWLRWIRQGVSKAFPRVERQFNRRAVPLVPPQLIRSHWGWEVPRIASARLPAGEVIEDWFWERGEKSLDRRCARLLTRPEVEGFLGVEHGALAALSSAREAGKPGVVVFLSPHHLVRARWVDRELEQWPELLTAGRRRVEKLAARRDARRDQEAATATWIETGSSFTTRSLVEAGVPPAKILTIPLGCPDPMPESALPTRQPGTCQVAFAGPVSVRKGAHYLLEAWSHVDGRGAELHFYGQVLLTSRVRQHLGTARGRQSVVYHGSIPQVDLSEAYRRSSVLVLPTLCDGFGLVVSEALAHGLPVITTENAGAADLVEHGKNGFIIPPADADALASCLQWCVDNPAALLEMRRAALAAAAGWSWGQFRRRHTELLGRALEPARPRLAARQPEARASA